jgi:hypothetical protein
MAIVINPTPVTPGTFSGMWATSLHVVFPTAERLRGNLGSRWLPYDGTTLLAVGEKQKQTPLPSTDEKLNAVLTALCATAQRIAEKKVDVKFIAVTASDPSKPVAAVVSFVDGSFHKVVDCFALASSDGEFGQVFSMVMGVAAQLAGLAVKA